MRSSKLISPFSVVKRDSLLESAAIGAIRFYRATAGAFVSALPLQMRCPYWPSCSHYAESAITTYGIGRGGILALKRILRCHPWAKGGPDILE